MPRKIDYDMKLSKLADKLQKNEEEYKKLKDAYDKTKEEKTRKFYKKLLNFMEKNNISPDTALEILEKNLPTT